MLKAVKRSRSLRLGAAGVVGRHNAGVEDENTHGSTPPLDQGPGPVSGTAMRLHTASGYQASRYGPQKAVIPPMVFPEGENPYLNRPLPPPPPPKTPKTSASVRAVGPPAASIMFARPSTSSGPGSGKTAIARPNFEKRLSKDDMFLTDQMSMSARRQKGLQPFWTGTRGGGLPTPEPSPIRMPSPLPISAMPSRIATPDTLSSGEIQIGMAIGSPTTYAPSPQPNWQPQALTPPRDVYSPPPPRRTPEPQAVPIQRQKTQKRRIFGSLFGSRKHSEPSKAAEIIDMNTAPVFLMPPSTTSLTKSGETTPIRSNTVGSKKPGMFRPMTRSRTEPQMEEAVQEVRRQEEPRAVDPWASPVQPLAPAPAQFPSLALSGPGLLDIEIPDIRLERYSIMFSGVLNPQGGSGNNTTSSLLARRQATLEKLKTINDRIVDEETGKDRGLQRRGTSPQPAKSPAFSLFPPPQGRQHGPGTPRSRSYTSPALLPSPSRTSFEPERQALPEPAPRRERKTVTIVSPRAMDERNRAAQVEKLREQQVQMQKAQQAQYIFGPEESALILDSPQSISDMSIPDMEKKEISNGPLPLKPRIEEPEWQMVSPPAVNSASSEASSTATKRTASSVSSSGSSVQTVQTQITRPSLDVDEGDAALKAAVEISIARQISISRQQRNLLRTTTTTAAAAGAARAMRSASVKMAMNPLAGNPVVGRVAETKLAMPRLVDPQFAQHRKSERVVLEAI
ncbi:hypothetical protein B0H67DRAFT_252565 [Lasiosphaeris hirsuta]|uniref:Uncharacterized protein n=1 Tax=Lasiosphaeris hirsuta TaxID=260670 RepID=A0AA40AHE4_9PEZI|nr:hypothetical protein B0H67DRAFT_252565 [Lasiosphaeris hirsuta]